MTKWETVLRQVLADIENKRFAPGDRFYTLRELGEAHDVSQITAQRVFRELVTRRVITTNRRAGAIVTAEAMVRTVVLCLRGEMFESSGRVDRFRAIDAFLKGFKTGAGGRFQDVEPVALDFLRTHLDSFKDKPVLISATAFLTITDTGATLNTDLLEQIRAAVNPIVFHGYCRLPGVTQVMTDLYGGMRKIVDHLSGRHTRFGCLMGNPGNPWFRPRMQAYFDGLMEKGLPFDPARLKITSNKDEAETFRALDDLLRGSDRPTALVCASDLHALHALHYCARHGIAVPGELAVTGFDNLPESVMTRPALTTLDGQDVEAGRRAAELLWRRLIGTLKEPTQRMVARKLIVRESSQVEGTRSHDVGDQAQIRRAGS